MKTTLLTYALVIGLAAGFCGTAFAAEKNRNEQLTDATFAQKAAAGGLTEVDLGKLAQQNGGSQDVKDFGAQMVTDHGKVNDSLKALAAKDNLTIPDSPSASQQGLIDKLSKQTGKEFDTAYIHAMVRAHIADKALFTRESANTQNPDLKQFAQDTLGVIDHHLAMIKDIAHAHNLNTTALAGHKHHAQSMGESSSANTPASTDMGSSGESKSGPAPGSNANPGQNMPPQ